MKTYEFTYMLIGTGSNEEEALGDALDSFMQDPGEPSRTFLLDVSPDEDEDE